MDCHLGCPQSRPLGNTLDATGVPYPRMWTQDLVCRAAGLGLRPAAALICVEPLLPRMNPAGTPGDKLPAKRWQNLHRQHRPEHRSSLRDGLPPIRNRNPFGHPAVCIPHLAPLPLALLLPQLDFALRAFPLDNTPVPALLSSHGKDIGSRSSRAVRPRNRLREMVADPICFPLSLAAWRRADGAGRKRPSYARIDIVPRGAMPTTTRGERVYGISHETLYAIEYLGNGVFQSRRLIPARRRLRVRRRGRGRTQGACSMLGPAAVG